MKINMQAKGYHENMHHYWRVILCRYNGKVPSLVYIKYYSILNIWPELFSRISPNFAYEITGLNEITLLYVTAQNADYCSPIFPL